MKDHSNLNLNMLKYFCTIYEERSISQAANKVNRKQPTLTQAMNTLRERYKDDLFVSSDGSMVPTRLAVELYGKFRDILATLNNLDELAQGQGADLNSIRYVLAVNDYYLSILLHRTVDSLHAYLPNAEINFQKLLEGPQGNYSQKISDLKISQLDAVICEFQEFDKDLKRKKIISDSWALVTSSEFAQEDTSSLIYIRCGTDHVDEEILSHYEFTAVMDALPELSYLANLVAQGNYIAAVPSLLISSPQFSPNRFTVKKELDIPFDLYLYWSSNRQYDAIFDVLKNILVRDGSYLVQENQFFSER